MNAIETLLNNLRNNRMDAYYVSTISEVAPRVASLLKEGETVAVGGSMTLEETGVLSLLRNGKYIFLDRYAPALTPAQRDEVFLRSMSADTYLCSANAVTMGGELYNVDGNANRIAALAYGPKQVILVVGINKIVDDLPAAIRRVKTVAAPLNAKRLNCDTYCARVGHCAAVDGAMTDGCRSDARICCSYLVTGQQRKPGRIKVILVGEPCGY